jgi:hypothetical protein
MEKAAQYLKSLLEGKGILIQDKHMSLLESVSNSEDIIESFNSIILIQEKMMNTWSKNLRINDFINSTITVPNATVGKPYAFTFDFSKESFKGINILSVNGHNLSIEYDKDLATFYSTFIEAGQFKLEILFKLEGVPPEGTT